MIPKVSPDTPTVWPTGETWNKVAEQLNVSNPSLIPTLMRQVPIRVSVQASDDLQAFSVVGLGNPVVTEGDPYEQYHTFESTTTDADTEKYAILEEPLQADLGGGYAQVGAAVVSGVATAIVDVTDPGHEYVKLGATSYTLESSSTQTPILLLYAPGTGVQTCKVLIRGGGGGADEFRRVTCQEDINPGETKTCDIAGGDGGQIDVVFDWIDDEKISAGKEIIVGRFQYEESGTEIWRPVSAQCEDPVPIEDIGDQPVPPTLPFEFDGSTTIEAAGRITTGGVTNISAYAIIEMSVAPPTSQHWVVCENNTGGGASNNRQWALTVKTNGTVGALVYSSGATTPARNYETIATLNADTQYKIGMQWAGGDITILIDDVPQAVTKIQDNPVTVIHDGNAYFQSMGIDAPNTRLQTGSIKVTEVSMSQDGTERVNWKPTAGSSTVTDDSGNGNNGTMVTIVP